MKFYTIVYLGLLLLIFLVDFFLYKQKADRTKNQKLLFFIPAAFFVTIFTVIKLFAAFSSDFRLNIIIMWFNLIFLLIYLPRLFVLLFNGLRKRYPTQTDGIVRVRNLVVGAYVLLMLISVLYTSRKIETERISLKIEKLPAAFKNYKIVQLSDIHLGARLYDQQFYEDMVKKVNAENADLIVFTGDLVNNFAEEMNGFEKYFQKMKSKDGKLAILGNHDYGDYSEWKSEELKSDNLTRIRHKFADFGFKLIENNHIVLRKASDSLVVVGVGNFRKKAYQNYSNLNKALVGLDSISPKILLSHNPVHWENEVQKHKDLVLTLAGHTHSGQFGISVLGKIYSPVVLLYPKYNGLYENGNQKLYISHGLGYIGLPIMIGIRPEINCITLN